MIRLLLVGVVAILTVSARSASAQVEPNSYEIAFVEEFSTTPEQYTNRVRRLRIVGWTTMVVGAGLLTSAVLLQDQGSGLGLPIGLGMSAAALFAVGGGSLLRARLMIGRRRRWRARHGASVHLRLTGPGAALRIAW